MYVVVVRLKDEDKIVDLPTMPRIASDDSSIRHGATRHVDYMTHDWKEEDIWGSWQYVVTRRILYSESSRLENALWRSWAKLKFCLSTITPGSLGWWKDCDITWLYGPLNSNSEHYPPTPPTAPPFRAQFFP
ncbi:protein phosphatase type 1 complex subunit Hex2/Reg1 [Histoplasma capsulatum]|uniref:Protein phosphatase type 1 complex subunit Hex2/Reg1 n=1 Tax=Ajellomyces capsulatus TaxID=5037 RepID=A0A8A1MG63_AJECA|nr:protein phosphatase type 1 complex subunit Hex2/Reg1 [Histoplasma capsulatum]